MYLTLSWTFIEHVFQGHSYSKFLVLSFVMSLTHIQGTSIAYSDVVYSYSHASIEYSVNIIQMNTL